MGKESNKDCRYGIDCPVKPRSGIPYCCGTCAKVKPSYITNDNKHLWTDKNGFHSLQGCKIPKENRPVECLDYDCRRYKFVAILSYIDGKWQALEGMELKGDEIEAVKMAVNMTMRINNGKNNS